MRLIHANPTDLVGQAIVFRHDVWRVLMVEGEVIRLKMEGVGGPKGVISLRQLSKCRQYPTTNMLKSRYPRLMRCLTWSCILTKTEAAGVIRSHLIYGPTALVPSITVARMGGTVEAIRRALECRHTVRKLLASSAYLNCVSQEAEATH